MNDDYSLLEWDTNFFGFKVAKLHEGIRTERGLRNIVKKMKADGVKLAHWFVDPGDGNAHKAAAILGFIPSSRKVIFEIGLRGLPSFLADEEIIPYGGAEADAQLVDLALQSGVYSRFKTDSRFPSGSYEKMYAAWIQNSVAKKNAKEVLVYKEGPDTLGMVTLGVKDGWGDIGLIAVDSKSRGKSIGKKLMHAALKKFQEWGIDRVRVATQQENEIACKFYKALGFKVGKIESVYHIWLDQLTNEHSIQ